MSSSRSAAKDLVIEAGHFAPAIIFDSNWEPCSYQIMKSRIMYIEDKSGGLVGPAHIGRVTFSRTGRSIYYQGRTFRSLKGLGFKANYYDLETGDYFWISGPKQAGGDALYGGSTSIEIDDDAREEYWRDIRGQPDRVREKAA